MSKRNHHYVPRFYLKQFASDIFKPDPKQINLYNIRNKRIISNISLSDQCYKRKFYGETNELEDLLSTLEGGFASVLKNILNTNFLPNYYTKSHLDLLHFIATQITRTNKRAEDLNEQTDMFMKMILSRDSRFTNVDLNKVKIGLNEPVLISLSNSTHLAFCLDDLKMHLFKASLNTEFIISDNPVFCYNIYLEKFPESGISGAVKPGLMIFLPISPQLCLILYDGNIYKIGKKNQESISLLQEDDVSKINSLQFIGSEKNLYFSGNIPLNYFTIIARRYNKARSEIGYRTIEFEEVGDTLKTLVSSYYHIPNLKLGLSPVSIRRDAQRVPLVERINMYRREVPQLPGDKTKQYNYWQEDNKARVFKRVRTTYKDPI